jgi:hypothetical protein
MAWKIKHGWMGKKNKKLTITKMPSLRVGNSSSFERTSSPFVTFPKTAYCQSTTIKMLKQVLRTI